MNTSSIKAVIQFSNINGGYSGSGYIDINPQFEDMDNNDYTLKSNSPCIDSGTPLDINYDLNGIYRPQGSKYDIGAYEYDKGNTNQNNSTIYNATGTWNYSILNITNNCPEDIGKPESGEMEISQNANSVIVNYEEKTYSGLVTNSNYETSMNDIYNNGTRFESLSFQLSSDTQASGSFSGSWSNVSFSCQWSGQFTAIKKSSNTGNTNPTPSNINTNSNGDDGGGGCFISTIQ